MSDFLIVMLAAIHCAIVLISVQGVVRERFNLIYLVALLSSIFYLGPIWLWFFAADVRLGYTFESIVKFTNERKLTTWEHCYPFFTCFSLCFGAVLASWISRKRRRISPEWIACWLRGRGAYLSAATFFLSFILACQLVYIGAHLNAFWEILALKRVHLPTAANHLFTFFGPVLIGTMHYVKERRVTPAVIVSFSIALLLAFCTIQRRDVFFVLIYILALRYFLSENGRGRGYGIKRHFILGLSMVCLISLLWYSRSIRKVLLNSGLEGLSGWEPSRTFFELLFGSGAGGYVSYRFVLEYLDSHGVSWGECFVMPILAFVPRALWAGKPVMPDALIQEHLGLTFSPSVFWINDLLLSFGPLALGVAFLVGAAVTFRYHTLLSRWSVLARLELTLTTALVIVLFKNGVAMFLTHYLFLYMLVLFSFRCAFLDVRRHGSRHEAVSRKKDKVMKVKEREEVLLA